MKGMERAKVLRDFLAFAQRQLKSEELLALKDARAAIERGEKPETIESFPNRTPEEIYKELGRCGKMTAFETSTGKTFFEYVMEFGTPVRAWAVVVNPYCGGEDRIVHLSFNERYTTRETMRLRSAYDGVFCLTDLFRVSDTPKANRARLQLIINRLVELGVESNPKDALLKLRYELSGVQEAQSDVARKAAEDNEKIRQRKIVKDAKASATPIEKTNIEYTDHPVAKRVGAYRKMLIGCLTLENINAVADIALDECQKYISNTDIASVSQKMSDGGVTYDRNVERQLELKRQYQWATGDEARNIRDEFESLRLSNIKWADEEAPRLQGETAKIMAGFLSKIRASTKRPADELKKTAIANPRQRNAAKVAQWMSVYPSDFVDAMASKPPRIKTGKRAHYRESEGEDELQLTKVTEPRQIIHELGHDLERRCPAILALEAEFYEKRKGNEEFQSLRSLTGKKYGSDEIAVKDHYLNPYMGKWYGGTAYELVSMGFEMFFTKPQELMKDKEYFKFILGILLTVTP